MQTVGQDATTRRHTGRKKKRNKKGRKQHRTAFLPFAMNGSTEERDWALCFWVRRQATNDARASGRVSSSETSRRRRRARRGFWASCSVPLEASADSFVMRPFPRGGHAPRAHTRPTQASPNDRRPLCVNPPEGCCAWGINQDRSKQGRALVVSSIESESEERPLLSPLFRPACAPCPSQPPSNAPSLLLIPISSDSFTGC